VSAKGGGRNRGRQETIKTSILKKTEEEKRKNVFRTHGKKGQAKKKKRRTRRAKGEGGGKGVKKEKYRSEKKSPSKTDRTGEEWVYVNSALGNEKRGEVKGQERSLLNAIIIPIGEWGSGRIGICMQLCKEFVGKASTT